MQYKVTWVIDIEARSAKAAAKEALKIQRDPDSIATVFEVAYNKRTQGKAKTRETFVRKEFDLTQGLERILPGSPFRGRVNQ